MAGDTLRLKNVFQSGLPVKHVPLISRRVTFAYVGSEDGNVWPLRVPPGQGFSNLNMSQSHLKDLFKTRHAGPQPQSFRPSGSGVAPEGQHL